MGLAFLSLSPQLLEELHPPFAGWLSVKNPFDRINFELDFLDNAEKLEPGTINVMAMMAARDMVHRFLQLGIPQIEERIGSVTERLLQGFQQLGVEIATPLPNHSRAGIVSIRVPQPEEVQQQLTRRGIFAAEREGVVRFSPHCVNTPAEADEVVANLTEIINASR
jgi:selenocysteine lyase/cysteine desulfurase